MQVIVPLPPERQGRSAGQALIEVRQRIAGAVAAGIWASDPPPVPVELGGIAALRFDPPGEPVATIVHFHGGAFRIGCPEQVAPFAAALATSCGVTVICPRYRLAPEHPFPAGLNDGLAALSAVADAHHRVIVSGDSAGGGLAASLTALRVAQGVPPIGLVLLSAWLDLRVVSACYRDNARTDPLFSRAAAAEAAELYLQGAAADHGHASPLLGAVFGFPPTFVNYGCGEVLAEDSRSFAAALGRAGVDVRCEGIRGMNHVAVTRGLELPGAAATFAAVSGFVDELTGKAAVAERRPESGLTPSSG